MSYLLLLIMLLGSCSQAPLIGDGNKKDSKVIHSIIAKSRDDMEDCATEYFRRGNEKSSVVMTEFSIHHKGVVIGVNFNPSLETEFNNCIETIIKELNFPKVLNKRTIVIKIPLNVEKK